MLTSIMRVIRNDDFLKLLKKEKMNNRERISKAIQKKDGKCEAKL